MRTIQKRRIRKDSRSRIWPVTGILIMMIALWAAAYAQSQEHLDENPMESRYSKAIRAEFAKCRETQDPTAQYLCTCKLLEEQCEAPRKLEHGNWNTVEFWPSENPSEREVQFILFPEFDFFGEYSPLNKGLVMTCMAGVSEINIFVGDNVDPLDPPTLYLGDNLASARFDIEDQIFIFDEPAAVYTAFQNGKDVSIAYKNLEDVERRLEFDTFGFDSVSKGWDKLCRETTS